MLRHEFDLMHRLLKRTLSPGALLLCAVATLTVYGQPAQGTFSLGGNAEITNSAPIPGRPRAFQLTSTCQGDCLRGAPFGTLTTASVIYLPDHSLKFKDLHTLSTDYRRWVGNCGGGSLRWEIALDLNGDAKIDGNLFIYFGLAWDFTQCSFVWEDSGNFIRMPDERFDTTQFSGGKFYDTYRGALALLGEAYICYILLVDDGAWYPGLIYPIPTINYQVFHVDNVRVNNDVYATRGASSLAQAQIPAALRQNLEQYVTGLSAPRTLFGVESYYGRRYSWTNFLRSGDRSLQRRATQTRGTTRR